MCGAGEYTTEGKNIPEYTYELETVADPGHAESASAAADLQATATAEQLMASYRRGRQAPPTEIMQIQARYNCSAEKAKEIFLDREMRKAASAWREVLNRDGVKGQYSIGKDQYRGSQELQFSMPFLKGRKKVPKVYKVFLRLRYTLVERMIDLSARRLNCEVPEVEKLRLVKL